MKSNGNVMIGTFDIKIDVRWVDRSCMADCKADCQKESTHTWSFLLSTGDLAPVFKFNLVNRDIWVAQWYGTSLKGK